MEKYFISEYKQLPGPDMEQSYVTGDYEVKYNVKFELIKNFAVACGYVTKRSQEIKSEEFVVFGQEDEWEEKIKPLMDEINKFEYDESFWVLNISGDNIQ